MSNKYRKKVTASYLKKLYFNVKFKEYQENFHQSSVVTKLFVVKVPILAKHPEIFLPV